MANSTDLQEKNFAHHLVGNKSNVPQSLFDNALIYDTENKQITFRGVDFVPKKMSELEVDEIEEALIHNATIKHLEVDNELIVNSRSEFNEDVEIKAILKVTAIQIGDCLLYWDKENECLRTTSGIASDSFISAGGVNNNV